MVLYWGISGGGGWHLWSGNGGCLVGSLYICDLVMGFTWKGFLSCSLLVFKGSCLQCN